MATTTNYGWTTPDDTALVKDGASAIRSLGSSIDTTTKNLNPQTTTGAIAYRSATSNVNTALPIGTAGQVLTVNSGATAPEWQSLSAGGMFLISTATPSAATTVSFTSIPTNYKALLLVWDSVFQSANDKYFTVRLNNDSGNNYHWAGTVLAAGSLGVTSGNATTAFGSNDQNAPIPRTETSASTLNKTANGQMWIFNADQTTGVKKTKWNSMAYATNFADYGGTIEIEGLYTGTSAISQIDFIRNSTQTITGTIRLYGVR